MNNDKTEKIKNDIELFKQIVKNNDMFFLIVRELAEIKHFNLETKKQDEIKTFIAENMDKILIKFQQKNIEFMRKIEANKSKVIEYFSNKYF